MIPVQNSFNQLSGIPRELSLALFGPVQTDVAITNLTSDYFQQIAGDWHSWRNAANALHVDLRKIPLRVRVDEVPSQEKLTLYLMAIESHYKGLNDDFLQQLNSTKDDIQGMDYNYEALDKLMDVVPKYKNQELLSQAKYHEALREFIHANKDAPIFDPLLFGSINNVPLLKILLEEGVEPATIEELPEEIQCDKKSLGWVTLLSLKSDFPTNLEWCKLILTHHQIDPQGLTYLLWLACHASYSDSESKQLEVIKFLHSSGAKWDIELISKYPPIIFSENKESLAFMNDTLSQKEEILQFIQSR